MFGSVYLGDEGLGMESLHSKMAFYVSGFLFLWRMLLRQPCSERGIWLRTIRSAEWLTSLIPSLQTNVELPTFGIWLITEES